MKIIDVDALLAQMQEYYEKRAKEAHMTGDRVVCVTWNDAVFLIKSAPTVDEVPARHGKWIRHNTYHGDDVSGSIDPDWRCSECGGQANVNAWFMYDLTDYCPNCGAKMDETKDEYVTLHHEDIYFIDEDAEKAFYESLVERKKE